MNSILINAALTNPFPGRWLRPVLLFLALLAFAVWPARAATRIWTGAHATSSDWSRNANWDTAAPANGDTVVFPAGAARLANNNDLAALQLTAIRFIGAGGGYTLSGNAITLGTGIASENTVGANTIDFTRIAINANARFVVEQAGVSLIIASDVRLDGNDLTANSSGILVLRGVISGAGSLFKQGAGLLTLSGTAGNIFTGDLRVNAGSVFLGKTAGMAVTNRLIIGDGAGGAQSDIAANVSNDQVNEVIVNSSGLWNVGNFTEEVSGLALNEGGDVTTGATGKLRLGSGAGITVTPAAEQSPDYTSIISGKMELSGGSHVIVVGDDADPAWDSLEINITADINSVGIGGLTKEGAGELSLDGNNTFLGAVVVNAGNLVVGHASALGGLGTIGSTTVNNDAVLIVDSGVAVGDEVLRLNSRGAPAMRGIFINSWSGDITLQRDTRIGVLLPDGEFTLSGVISGTGDIVKQDAGLLRIAGNSANNTFDGDLLVNAGTVELDKGTIGGLVAVPGRLIIGDGEGGNQADVARLRKDNQVSQVTVNGSGLWDLGVFDDEVSDLVLNDGGDVTTAATGLLRLGINADVTVTPGTTAGADVSRISGNLELLVGTHRFTVENGTGVLGDGSLVVNAVVSGAGGMTKAGRDQMSLSGANSFFGPVVVDAGQLVVEDELALGLPNQGTRINNSGTLSLFGSGTVSGEPLTLDTDGLNPPGAVNALVISGDWVWTGDVTLARQSQLNVLSAASLDLSGVIRSTISGAGGVTKNGGGTLTLSGNAPNTYLGVTTVNEGRLLLNKTGVNVAVPGRLIIGDDVGGANADVVECLSVNEIGALSTVTVNSSGQFILGQESIGALAGSGNVVVSGSLNAGAANTTTVFHGVISGAGAFNKIGTGTLTFNGNNTYTGGTGIADGTLLVNGQQPASFVLIQPDGRLGGSGRVGNLSMFSGAEVAPGNSPGRLTSGNLQLATGTTLLLELNGPVPGTQHDQLKVFGTANLGGAKLFATLDFIPTLGQPLVIIDNDGTDDVIDQFNGLAEGDTVRVNQIPFIVSYEGGDGNDVTLTATNTSISVVSTRVEAGNGNAVIDPNECNHLFIALMNETGGPLAVSHVVLDSATPGVTVTQQRSDYANFASLGLRENTVPFQFRTSADFECGRLIEFLLTITVTGGGGGTFTIPFTVPSGGAGVSVAFNNGANTALVDQGQLISTLTVSGAGPLVGKVAVSLHITHPSAGDLVLRLRSPSGTIVNLAENLGGTTDNYGSGCGQANRTTFDDAAAIRIAAGAAPFIGSFTPEQPLAAFRGEDPNGDWQLLIADTVAGDTGELRCWSLAIAPPECSDGGGQCESCVPAFTGRFTADMPSTLTRFVRDGVPSGCGSEKICPAVTPGARLFYRVHLITNTGPATCVSAVLIDLCRASNLRLHAAAYLGSYDAATPCANYLGDTGSELTTASASFSFAAPENAIIAIVVSSPVATPTCVTPSYLLQVHGLPCPPPTLHIAKTGNPDEVRLYWSTAYPDFDLQRTPNLNGAAPYPFANVPFTPFVVNGDYSVTNATTSNDAYFRLRKP